LLFFCLSFLLPVLSAKREAYCFPASFRLLLPFFALPYWKTEKGSSFAGSLPGLPAQAGSLPGVAGKEGSSKDRKPKLPSWNQRTKAVLQSLCFFLRTVSALL
jgi:hypothetical protein